VTLVGMRNTPDLFAAIKICTECRCARKPGQFRRAEVAVGGVWQFDSLKEIFTSGEIKAMIISSIVLGVIGKFLTNFFKEDEK
jgi:hypothetical protein